MELKEATIDDIPLVRALFIDYQKWLGVDLCFQQFEEELATLPGLYAPPKGVIYIAFENKEAVGCACVRPHTGDEAELKRLYVQHSSRGRGIGKALFRRAMSKAKEIGYSSIVLDTLPIMKAAKRLYLAYGFKPIRPYYHNPIQGAEYYRFSYVK